MSSSDADFDVYSVIDDIWISIFSFLNSKQFIEISQCCKHFHTITDYNKQPRIKYYWQLQCARLCSDIKIDNDNGNSYGPNKRYKICSIDINWIKVYHELKAFIHKNGVAQIKLKRKNDNGISMNCTMIQSLYIENGVAIEDAASLGDINRSIDRNNLCILDKILLFHS